MVTSRDEVLAVLRHNLGFDDPEQWIEYAIEHSFKSINAVSIPNCPDCGREPSGEVGQYVYYSTLIHLLTCGSCHLIWANTHVDPVVVGAHFEHAYKNRTYFHEMRSGVFRHLVEEIGKLTPKGGTVLDIGGAQGDLMHLLKRQRSDIKPVVHDISKRAVMFAADEFGLPVICGDIGALEAHDSRYDVVVLSDVLYYETRIADFWRLLPLLLVPGGSVILRVPNKLPLIHARQILSRLVHFKQQKSVQDRINHFNPEHIYILSRQYLTARLTQAGFASVRVLPSPPLASGIFQQQALANILFGAATAISQLSDRRLTPSPSMLVIATGITPRDTSLSGIQHENELQIPVPRVVS